MHNFSKHKLCHYEVKDVAGQRATSLSESTGEEAVLGTCIKQAQPILKDGLLDNLPGILVFHHI